MCSPTEKKLQRLSSQSGNSRIGDVFSPLKRIQTFLRNIRKQDHLKALTLLSMEKTMTNRKLIVTFAVRKERRAKFLCRLLITESRMKVTLL